jgi:dTDP-4-amino-4,6-dideoxygalactose transaminase
MIKLLIPDMPTADDLLPYLRRIDAARVYVNHGPLVQELEARLEQITGVPCVTVSSGTAALELALQALNASQVVLPAMTFGATGLASAKVVDAEMLTLCDVDAATWQMLPVQVPTTCLAGNWGHNTVLMPVATFGMPVKVDIDNWEHLPTPVVVDAAGAFPHQQCSKDPNITTCFSLHATKFIGCGEGGFVASANKELIERVRRLSMFGEGGTNAKMSEYHAAVALASLGKADEKLERSPLWWAAGQYIAALGDKCRIVANHSICNMLLSIPVTPILINKLLDEGIETKQWYRPYLDERPEFGGIEEGRFPVTDHLRMHLLGVPFHNFLTEADVAHVCETLRRLIK